MYVALWLLGGAVIWGWPSEIWVTAGREVSGSGSGSGVTMGVGNSEAGAEAWGWPSEICVTGGGGGGRDPGAEA